MKNKNKKYGIPRESVILMLVCLFFVVLLTTGCNEKKDPKDTDPKDYATLCNKAHDDWVICREKVFSVDGLEQHKYKVAVKCKKIYEQDLLKAENTLTEEQKKSKAAAIENAPDPETPFEHVEVTPKRWVKVKADYSECRFPTHLIGIPIPINEIPISVVKCYFKQRITALKEQLCSVPKEKDTAGGE